MSEPYNGIDVSNNNGLMNWKTSKSKGVVFAAIRATVGDYYTDPSFRRNWEEAKANGILVTAYHVYTPATSPEYRNMNVTPEKQIDRFRSVMLGLKPDLPVVLDCELTRNRDKKYITAGIAKCLELLERQYLNKPFVYTAKNWWDINVDNSSKWRQYPLWVANYTTSTYPVIPDDWSNFVVWQWSADRPVPNMKGREYGGSSTSMDLNRLYEDTARQYGIFLGVPSSEPPRKVVGCKPNGGARIRSSVSLSGQVIGYANAGSIWPVEATEKATDGKSWYRIAKGVYIAAEASSPIYE